MTLTKKSKLEENWKKIADLKVYDNLKKGRTGGRQGESGREAGSSDPLSPTTPPPPYHTPNH